MTRPRLTPLRDPADVPKDPSESEARAFWDQHEITPEYLERAGPVPVDKLPPVRASEAVELLVPADALRRIKTLARKRRLAYRTLLTQFVIERLEEEERRAARGRAGSARSPAAAP